MYAKLYINLSSSPTHLSFQTKQDLSLVKTEAIILLTNSFFLNGETLFYNY